MAEAEKQLLKLIDVAERVLITSHISPDPDAICSSLLLFQTLKANYPAKKISLVLEESSNRDLDFLLGYSDIRYGNLPEAIKSLQPQLLIITDANNFDRVSRNGGPLVRQLAEEIKLEVVIIDHHEPGNMDKAAVYINNGYPAATQDVYKTMFSDLGLRKPPGYADTTLFGILSDTARFKFRNPKHRETLAVVSELIDAGADIESLENKNEEYTLDQMLVLAQLAQNAASEKDYSYSYISDDFTQKWRSEGKLKEDFKSGCEIFVNGYIRNISPNKWGFALYQEMEPSPKNYAVSLRAQSGVKDVSAIARKLGGGGHKPAAGAKFSAKDINEALRKVFEAIEQPADN